MSKTSTGVRLESPILRMRRSEFFPSLSLGVQDYSVSDENSIIVDMKIFTLVLLWLSHTAWSQTDQVCKDLSRFACAPGTYDDGTGKATTPNYEDDSTKEIYEKTYKRSIERFKKALVEPDNSALRRGVLSASGLSMRKDCEDAENEPQGECLKLMSDFGAMQIFAGDADYRPVAGQGVSGEPADIDERYYLNQLDAFQEIREESKKELRSELKADELDERIRKTVKTVKRLMIEKIKAKVQDPAMQKIMVNRIIDAKPGGSNCSDSDTHSVPEVLIPNMFYHTFGRRVKYCFGNLSRVNSDFNLAFFIAHELGHSIDPCGIQRGPKDFSMQYKSKSYLDAEREYPLGGLISCLRKDTSLRASRDFSLDQAPRNPYVGPAPQTPQLKGDMPPGLLMPYGGGVESSNAKPVDPFKSFCSKDQIGEGVSDWWAAEVLPDYLNEVHPNLTKDQIRLGMANAIRPYCHEDEKKEAKVFRSHPTYLRRGNFLLLAQPDIRAKMGCPPELPEDREYCTGHPENPMGEEIVTPRRRKKMKPMDVEPSMPSGIFK